MRSISSRRHRSLRASTGFVAAMAAVALLLPARNVSAQATSDRELVRQAVLDYVEGIYNAQPERIHKSVSPEMAKLGLYRGANDAQYRPMGMTFTQLVGVANNYSKTNKIAPDTPKKIDIYEVLDRTASVKLTAQWGSDYMLLAKQDDGRWVITHVLWQSRPR